MLNRRCALTAMVAMTLPPICNASEKKIVSVADFGAQSGVPDVGPAVQRAIASLSGIKDATLLFPPGVYRFAATSGACIAVANQYGFAIHGEGAELVFDGSVAPFLFHNCPGLTLTGFSVDWARLPYTQGDLLDVAPDRRSAVLLADRICPIRGDEAFGRIGLYDRATKALVPGGLDTANVIDRVADAGDQRLRLHFKTAMPLRAGETLVLRHAGHAYHVLSATQCDNLTIRNVRVFACPSMALTADNCRSVSFQNVSVSIKPGTARLLSSNADAVHLLSCDGDISVGSCRFEGMGDDGINVTGAYIPIVARKGSGGMLLRTGVDQSSLLPLHVGDRARVVSGADLSRFGEVTIKGRDGDEVSVEGMLPQSDEHDLYLIDETRTPRVRVHDCRFSGNRARGILAHSDAVIERCTFERQSGAAVLLAPDLRWREGPSVERVTVYDNVIQSVNTGGGGGGAVWIDAFTSPDGNSEMSIPRAVNQDVSVEGNTFSDCSSTTIYASSTQGIEIRGNTIQQCGNPAIILKNIPDGQIVGNKSDRNATILLQNSRVERISVQKNNNLSIAPL